MGLVALLGWASHEDYVSPVPCVLGSSLMLAGGDGRSG